VRQRSERFEKHRRIAELEHKKDPSKPFGPLKPWCRSFQDAANDEVFWSKEVHKPALWYLAKGRSIDESVTDHTAQPWMEQPGGPIVAVSAGRRYFLKRQSSSSHDSGNHTHATNRKGVRICEAYNEGKCTRTPGTCRDKHQCSGCLDTHPLCSGLCGGRASGAPDSKKHKLPDPPPAPGKGRGRGGKGRKKR
jgi:hypothetical protein